MIEMVVVVDYSRKRHMLKSKENFMVGERNKNESFIGIWIGKWSSTMERKTFESEIMGVVYKIFSCRL